MSKVAFLKLERGDFNQGFQVTLDIAREGKFHVMGVSGFLRQAPEIPKLYQDWQAKYCSLESGYRRRLYPMRFSEPESSIQDCSEAAEKLKVSFQNWLRCDEFRSIEDELLADLNKSDEIRIILQTENEQLRKLPWETWRFFQRFPNAELSISPLSGIVQRQFARMEKVRILAILGNSDGIDTQTDKQILESLPCAEVYFLVEPTREEFNRLWEDDWDILFFAGHSSSQEGETGYIYINQTDEDKLDISELEETLRTAIANGLRLAIFNSCDGLGLARQLEKLHIPQVIVMREPVPDKIAQEFLKYFLTDFARGMPLYASVRRARRKLQELLQIDKTFPGASWLPVVCQNPLAEDFVWPSPRREHSAWHSFVKLLRQSSQLAIASGLAIGLVGSVVIALSQFRIIPSPPPADFENKISSEAERFAQVRNVRKGTFNYGGSTTWAPIRKEVDPEIAMVFPGFKLRYTSPTTGSPGSTTGIKMLLNDQLAFSQSSRSIKQEEYQLAREKGFAIKEIPVGLDAIAIAVNPKLNVPGLTVDELKKIYIGAYTNWKQVGGPDLAIAPYSRRKEDGGTVEFFGEKVLQGTKFGANVRFIPTTTEALREVAVNPGGIYYASAPEVVGQCTVKTLPIGHKPKALVPPYQEPFVPLAQCPDQRNQVNAEAFKSEQYPITRQLFVVIKQNGQKEQRAGEAYANLLLTDQGQELIEQAGFVGIR